MNRARLVLAALAVLMVMLGLGSAAQAAPSDRYVARPGERVEVFQARLFDGRTGATLGTVPVEKVTSPQPAAITDCPHYGSLRRFCLWKDQNFTGTRSQYEVPPLWDTCVYVGGSQNDQSSSAYNGTLSDWMHVFGGVNGNPYNTGTWPAERFLINESYANLGLSNIGNNTATMVCVGSFNFMWP